MFFHRILPSLIIAAVASGIIALSFLPDSNAGSAPSKYEKCRLKCIEQNEQCVDDVRGAHGRSEKIDELTRCDMRKSKCLAKCS